MSSRDSKRRVARVPRTRRAGRGRVRGRGRPRPGRNQGPVAGRAPMTAISRLTLVLCRRLGGRRATTDRDAEDSGRLEVEPLLDLDRRDLVAEPVLILARGMQPPLTKIPLARGVHPPPACLVS